MDAAQRQLSERIDDATQRLVEVELHHADLGAGYGPENWPAEFTAMELAEPMRTQRQDRLDWAGSPGTTA